MKKISLKDNVYRIGDLNAFAQLNLARRLTPMSVLIQGMVDPKNQDKDMTLLIVLMLGQLSDIDNDYVIKQCLGVVLREQGDTVAKILSSSGDLMFSDIGMKGIVDLTTAVILENLGSFFQEALSAVEAVKEAAPT